MRISLELAAAAAACQLWLAAWPASALEPPHLVADFPRGQAVLETAGPRCLLIDVYFAVTAKQRAQGLMFVERLPEFEGMYFGYGGAVELVMWMENTLLPLDMLFVRQNGRIGHIARDTEPFSRTRISSRGPAVGVLELNGGFAERWRVASGTRLLIL